MEHKLNQGAIFKNDYKGDQFNAPDFKGKMNVDGETKDVALWLNPSKEGKKEYFTIKISEPYVKGGQASAVDQYNQKAAAAQPSAQPTTASHIPDPSNGIAPAAVFNATDDDLPF